MKRVVGFFACAAAAVAALLLASSPSHGQGQFGPDGDITAVNVGSGMLGGGTRGAVTVAGDKTYFQRRFTTPCGAGSAVQSVDVDGVPTCITAGGGEVVQAVSTTGTINDLSLNASTTVLKFTGTSSVTLTGVTGGTDGRVLKIDNSTTSTLAFSHDVTSTAANRFFLVGATAHTLQDNASLLAVYSGTDSRWHLATSIEGVTAGTGLSGGGTAASPTLTVNITGASCASNSLMSALGATGTGTCRSLDLANTNSSTGTLNITRSFDEPVIEFTGAGTVTVAGIGPPSFGGIQTIRLINNTGNKLTLAHESGSATAAAWRIVTSQAVAAIIDVEGIALLVYSATDSRWHFTSGGSDTLFSTSGGQNGLVPGSVGASTSCLKGDGTWGTCGNASVAQSVSFSGTQNDYASVNATTTYLRVNGSTTPRINGITGGSSARELWIVNVGSVDLILSHEDAGSTAANRLLLTVGINATHNLVATCATKFIYDSTLSRWVQAQLSCFHLPGAIFDQTVQFNASPNNIAGNLTPSGFVQPNGGFFSGTNSVLYNGGSTNDLNCAYTTNGTATCLQNATGYNGGTTQFRDWKLQDGKGADVIAAIGSTKAVTFGGPITFNAASNVGNELTLSGTFAANGTTNSIGNASTDTLAVNARLSDVGTLPTISTCASGTRTGGQWSFTVTPGSTTACTATFATACSSAPTCSLTPGYNTTAVHYISAVSGSALTFNVTGTGWSGAQPVHVLCICH